MSENRALGTRLPPSPNPEFKCLVMGGGGGAGRESIGGLGPFLQPVSDAVGGSAGFHAAAPAPSSDLLEFRACSRGLGQVAGPEVPAALPRPAGEPPARGPRPETPSSACPPSATGRSPPPRAAGSLHSWAALACEQVLPYMEAKAVSLLLLLLLTALSGPWFLGARRGAPGASLPCAWLLGGCGGMWGLAAQGGVGGRAVLGRSGSGPLPQEHG